MAKIDSHSTASNLWLEYKNGLKFYILKKTKDESVAEELSHEVLMKLYKACCSGIEIKNVRSWIFQIAHNTTVDFLRKKTNLVHEVPESTEEEAANSYEDAIQLVRPLINLLPEKYGAPLQLSDLEGLKQQEVAKRLNLSLTATKSRVQRARKLLKEKILECGDYEMDSKGNLVSLDLKKDCDLLGQDNAEEKK